MNQRLIRASAHFEQWIKESALPFWMQNGMDPMAHAHYERFLSSGEPDRNCDIRVRVQARQLFVYAFAYDQGWCQHAYPTVDRLWDFLESKAAHPEAPDGYTHLLSPEFEVIDTQQDLYDHAFFILAYAWLYRAFGKPEALLRVNQIVDYLDKAFGSSVGGWIEGSKHSTLRRQNPHMHLFEAFLTLYRVTGISSWLARASEIFTLFQTRFFDDQHGVLREYFDNDWQISTEPDADIIEPGHMMEWVWLLRWYEELSGRPVSYYADTLYEKSLSIGMSESGLLYDEVTPDGTPLKQSKRCWPMTELIKANIAQAKMGYQQCEEAAAIGIEKLFEFYLSDKIPGLYIDQRGEQDEVIVDCAPASTLYHLIVAASETSRYCRHIQNNCGYYGRKAG